MPVYALSADLVFPPPNHAEEYGLLAVGGDARPERLLLAYAQGIFRWPSPDQPLLWYSPDPRCLLPLEAIHVSRSLKKRVRSGRYEIRFDHAFDTVMRACAEIPRPGQDGTWITEELFAGYGALHRLGYAHSIEAYEDGELVGGLYGISLGRAFFGESMFATRPDASKVAFISLLGHARHWGFSLLDCQVMTEHLRRFGAVDVDRDGFLVALRDAVAGPTRVGSWTAEMPPEDALTTLLRDRSRR